MAEPLRNIIDPGWAEALEPVAGRIAAMGDVPAGRGRRRAPVPAAGENVLRAFKQPFADVRVLIVGQDPYPTPGHPVGLSFSVAPEVKRLPPSLVNIFREYSDDLGYPTPSNGDLTPWTERGVLLLNRVLTVQPGKPGSHRGRGWEEVTEQAIRALAARRGSGRRAAGRDLVGTGRADARPAARRACPGNRRTRARIRRPAGSSAPARSAGPISCLNRKAPSRSTGSCPRDAYLKEPRKLASNAC
jgi:uracil-DNA glycosylase